MCVAGVAGRVSRQRRARRWRGQERQQDRGLQLPTPPDRGHGGRPVSGWQAGVHGDRHDRSRARFPGG